MSVTHLDSIEAPRASDASRKPPQDIPAEQSVLGGMMLSKDAIADVVEIVRGHDFYRPAHETIYESIIDLYGRGEPADAVTVSDELTKRGEINRIGGPAYLHELIQTVPTAANAGYYAEIVAERAVLRRLVNAGTKIVQMGYGQDGEVEDLVNQAQAEIYAVAERRTAEDYVALKDVMESTVDEIEASGHRGDGMTGVPTGFYELDELTHGLHPGQMIVIAARPAVGKALSLDTPLPTPHGWTTMGEVRAGDEVLAADGRPTTVVAVTDVMLGRQCFEVTFDDGSTLVADAEHQWLTETRASRKSAQEASRSMKPTWIHAAVRTTTEIAASLRCQTKDARLNHSVVNSEPVQLPEAQLPIGPYTLGAWLGDGHSNAARVTTADPEVLMRIGEEGYETAVVDGITYSLKLPAESFTFLRSLGVLGNKHIPLRYLRASEQQRRALLAGLLDSDGTVTSSGCVQFAVTSRTLAEDARELIHSLGYRTGWSEKAVSGRSEASSTSFTITFASSDAVFGLQRKHLLHKERDARATPKRTQRFITAVRPVDSVPVRCIQVAHESHLYLAGRSFIPTHNSTFALDFARSAAIKNNLATVMFSLEMGRNEIAMRLLSAEATIGLQDLRKGTIKDEQWSKIATTMGRMNDAPLFIDDSPNMSLMEIRAKCRRLKQQHDLKLVILDYLQLMSSGKKVESRQQEVSEFSRALKLLAKELQVPVIALSQLNRGSEQRADKRPMVSDLRESGCLTADTRVLRSDTGSETTMGELFEAGAKDVPVWSLGDDLRYVERHLTHVFSTGIKPVHKLTLASGRTIRATANHPFFTYEGWRALGDLAPGDRLGVPRHVDGPSARTEWDDRQVIMLAHLIGDGSFVRRQPIRYATRDEQNITAVSEAAGFFGVTPARDDYAVARCTTLRLPAPFRLARGKRNPIAQWLDGMGLFGLRSHEKFAPESVFSLPKSQIALFLRHLWATDGSITLNKAGNGGRVYYASTSRRLVDDIARLLLRFGITARVHRATLKENYRPGYTLDVSGSDDQRRFLQEIGVHGERSANAERLLEIVKRTTPNTNVDTMPLQVWDKVRKILDDSDLSHRQFQEALGTKYCGSSLFKSAPSRQRLGRVAEVLDSAELDIEAINDLFWDSIIAIEPDGEEEVFDATVLGNHNFIANGIAVHNSIEQDADMVILLHREDVYDKESPRAGEADILIAKHRNGPTKDIVVAFQGHYSRFANMAGESGGGGF
ncbi:replicative DNA helicase [Arthrobacter cavernae]|uniref:Replicative DNA helicase n=1 Tax=Arthrobacter cavernae TaxID=2817681 RepID=A0A939KME5_9MICC|nr:replicative DNA helicase [Arthrobacter cavernae]MBO1268198.1 replicative DNA helicase [Arthrobacter cavernae]